MDPYGLFPTVAPGGGTYSLKLGNNASGSGAERARYYITVPTGSSAYALIYRYAVVFQAPYHAAYYQPRFQVKASDSATGAPLPCAEYSFIADTGAEGFYRASIDTMVYYRPWTTGMLNLSGLGGHTVRIEFTATDCGLGAHFGYGYVDMTCGVFAISNEICRGDSAILTGPLGFYGYSWYDSSFTTLLGTSRILTTPMPATGTRTYALVLHQPPGYACTDTLYSTIHDAHIDLTPMHDTLFCPSTPVVLAPAVSTPGTSLSYLWSASYGGVSCATCSSITVSPSYGVQYILTVTNAEGCTATDTVMVAPQFTPLSLRDTMLCDTSAISLGYSVTGFYPPYNYSWAPSSGLSCVTCPVTVAHNLATTAYIWQVSDNSGCVVKDTVTVYREQMTSTAITDTTICLGDTILLTANITSGAGTTTYAWLPTSSVQCSTCAVTPAYPSASTSFTVTGTSIRGCQLTNTITVHVRNFALTMPDDVVRCIGLPETIYPTTTAVGALYNWSPATGLNCTTCASPTATDTENRTYTLTVTDNLGCKRSDTIAVNRHTMYLWVIADTTICRDETIHLTPGPMDPTYPATLTWSPPDHLSCHICDEPEASPVDNITYYVHATDITGCVADDSVKVKVELCNIWFPSAFTPNFDGKNDVARVKGNLKWYSGYTLAIFNRFGENVFLTDDIYAGWDGLYKGTPADVGVYFYKISFVLNGERKMLAGDITLIR